MSEALILLHEKALRLSHPVFKVAPKDTQAIFIWDDDYFRKVNYSLKRLVFLYETLCELPIQLFRGATVEVVRTLQPSGLFIPETNHPIIQSLIAELQTFVPVVIVPEEAFVELEQDLDPRRFFQYWGKIKNRTSQKNGK
jgi:hypothetical protein